MHDAKQDTLGASRKAHDSARPHVVIAADTPFELGVARGLQLRGAVADAYDWYSRIFRGAQVSLTEEQRCAELSIDAIRRWRPEIVEEYAGLASATQLSLLQVAALNARSEILAQGVMLAKECSTVVAKVDQRWLGAQSWDWHLELDRFWHTQEVAGPGRRFVGVTEQGILGKVGINDAGLAVHFNILGHTQDSAMGVPVHVLAYSVLTQCVSVSEAIALVRSADLCSSSALTLLDTQHAVSLEVSPLGAFAVAPVQDAVIRTNHFLDERTLAGQKTIFEPDSSDRYALLEKRLQQSFPQDDGALVDLLASGPGEAPLCCIADPNKPFGERWQTLFTAQSDPSQRTLRVFEGMPSRDPEGEWRVLTA